MVRYVDIFDSDVPEESLEVRGNHVSIISPIAVKRHVSTPDPIHKPMQFTTEDFSTNVTKGTRRPTQKNLERSFGLAAYYTTACSFARIT